MNILQSKDLNTFIKVLMQQLDNINMLDILKAAQILTKNNKQIINQNLTNKQLNKIVYDHIQNEMPQAIINVIEDKYYFSDSEKEIIEQIYAHFFHFDTIIYNHQILRTIDSIILEERKKNISLIKDNYNFDEIFDNEKDIIMKKLNDNTNKVVYNHLEDLHYLIHEKNIKDINQLNKILLHNTQYIEFYIKEIIGTLLAKNICKKYNYDINVAMLFSAYIPTRINMPELILQAINNINKCILFSDFIGTPWDFINFNDSTKESDNIVYSTISPYDFSGNRSGPLIVIESEVLRGNNDSLPHHEDLLRKYRKEHGIETDDDDKSAAYTQGYERLKNVGVGSYFNEVAVLEFIQGNKEQIKQALINDGYQKVYLNNSLPWTSKEYKRIANKFKIKRLLIKVN